MGFKVKLADWQVYKAGTVSAVLWSWHWPCWCRRSRRSSFACRTSPLARRSPRTHSLFSFWTGALPEPLRCRSSKTGSRSRSSLLRRNTPLRCLKCRSLALPYRWTQTNLPFCFLGLRWTSSSGLALRCRSELQLLSVCTCSTIQSLISSKCVFLRR